MVTPRDTENPQSKTPSTFSLKSVLLDDWWLVTAEDGHGLAVSGLASRERLGSRMFRSATIVKRHNTTVVEAKDGIIITITGFINQSRTLGNGITRQVCSRFRLGFPYCWEKYATKGHSEGSGEIDVPTAESSFSKSPMFSGASGNASPHVFWVDLPVSRIQDLLLFPLRDPQDLVEDITGQSLTPPFKHTPVAAHSDLGNIGLSTPSVDKTPMNQNEDRPRDEDRTLEMSYTMVEEGINPRRGVVTRRMAGATLSAHLVVDSRTSVRTVNDVVTDETSRKRKKARDGKKSIYMDENWGVSGTVMVECVKGGATRSMACNPMTTYSELENRTPDRNANHVVDKSLKRHKTAKAGKRPGDVDDSFDSTAMKGGISPSRGVVTRSISRLRNLVEKQPNDL